jgi:AcrR family transcriptional regulator
MEPAVASPRVPGRAERNKLEKHRRIMRAARELFRRKGFAQTTTSEIAARADVGKGTVFLYARSKNELLVMFFQEVVGQSVERGLATVPTSKLIDQLMNLFTVMIEYNRRDMDLARVFAKEISFIDGDRTGIAAVMARLYRGIGALIDNAKHRGEVADTVDSRVLAHNLFALYFMFLLRWLGGKDASPDISILRKSLAMQLDALGPAVTNGRSSRTRRD